MLDQAAALPERGRRPRNRRALILAAASDLFARCGYDQIGMSDLADAVAVRPSALYRHFSGKQHLLREVIAEGLIPLRNVVGSMDLTDRTVWLFRLGGLALDERRIGMLWQREARHMAPEDHARLRAELYEIGQTFIERVRDARPDLNVNAADLITWSIMAVLMSTSFHNLELPRPAYEALLAELAETVLETQLPADFPAPGPAEPTPTLTPHLRREALLAQAVRMFAQAGYTGVGIEDIGAAVGIAGPSIYNHFPSKLDMLVTALRRGTATLQMDMSAVYATAGTAPEALRRLVRSYVGFTQVHHDLVDLLITETRHLPEDEQRLTRQVQHDYISEWVHLLRMVHPGIDLTPARVRVHAVLTVANDVARTPHLRRNPSVPAALETICTRLLAV
ncbi:TetR/AcrR family transcriptional regulator [Micromonospora sp. NPDC050495]|uniref:TetR/AcrR family transcriptional regulator n=1 Tax=Micromonospora sp. NPDC050495 TaxID=3154936 RepID=UPI0033E2E2A1